MLNIRYKSLSVQIGAIWDEASKLLEVDTKEDDVDREDKVAYQALYALMEAMDSYKNKIEYLSKRTIEGRLLKQPNGRFAMFDNRENHIQDFTCGAAIEIFHFDDWDEKDIWQFGRVEMRNKGASEYYFVNDRDNPALENGMRIRVRI